jgi:hypothetical protein
MSLVAWIADLYSYFCYSHALDFTITGTQRQRPSKVNRCADGEDSIPEGARSQGY